MSARRFFVGGNWKANGGQSFVRSLVADLNAGNVPEDVEVVISPPSLYLAQVRKEIAVSAQNCYHQDGAFTGEVTASMVKDLGLPWVILGHSERRSIFKESDELIGTKVAKCLGVGLKVIACVGEQLSEREEGKTTEVVFSQLKAIAANVTDPKGWENVVIGITAAARIPGLCRAESANHHYHPVSAISAIIALTVIAVASGRRKQGGGPNR
ncbi:triosephosphate isomerase [Acanthamoeba castellanii str. Neff]|uniref:Triosephosphate isomerase n=1 Tax=Acanthamoeba castellanii (strain ATCC 30010 / Neff) TaxID=1257118 RepID=L8GE90_ACACF|nr:triosephosphate isomerase [Acanthamoeba castellanii str. Neff]ELR11347.1 triosephosphate isomerase [Acanthamoeba castellanii str. Neff]